MGETDCSKSSNIATLVVIAFLKTLRGVAASGRLLLRRLIQFEFLNGCIVLEDCFKSIEAYFRRRLLLEYLSKLSDRWHPISAKADDEHVAISQLIRFAADRYGRVDCVVQDFEFPFRTFC